MGNNNSADSLLFRSRKVVSGITKSTPNISSSGNAISHINDNNVVITFQSKTVFPTSLVLREYMHEVPLFSGRRGMILFSLRNMWTRTSLTVLRCLRRRGWEKILVFLEESFHHNIGGKSKYVCKTFITFIVAKKEEKQRDLEVVFIFLALE